MFHPNKITAYIIGCGHIGTRRAEILNFLDVDLVLFDKDLSRAYNLLQKLGGNAKILIQLENVQNYNGYSVGLICTPPSSHLEIAQILAERGIHLFIEKPLSNLWDTAKIQTLWQTMQENGVIGIMGQSYRFLPSLRRLAAQLDVSEGILAADLWQGQSLLEYHPEESLSISYLQQSEEGGIRDSLGHSLDIVQWLFGRIYAVAALQGKSGLLSPNLLDNVTVLLRMKDGAVVTLHNDFIRTGRKFTIQGVLAASPRKCNNNAIDWKFDPSEVEEMYTMEMRHLCSCIRSGVQGQPDIAQGILNLDWMEAIRLASATGTWQKSTLLAQELQRGGR